MAKMGEGYPYYFAPQRYKKDILRKPDYAANKYQIQDNRLTKPIARNVTHEHASLIVDALNFWYEHEQKKPTT